MGKLSVQEYIRNFSQPGDVVLDPFAGSGVTAIEALMIDRKAISLDLNPLSVFITTSLMAPVRLPDLYKAFEEVKSEYQINEPKIKEEIAEFLLKYPYPKGIRISKVVQNPRNGKIPEFVEQLFSPQQLAQLAYLRHLILKQKDKNIRSSLLLAFSSMLTVTNQITYQGDSGGPNASVFVLNKYRFAEEEVITNTIENFESKFNRVVAAKKEIAPKINEESFHNAQILRGTATDLNFIKNESVDYIYTDPPYGAKLPYLDLSVMWNAWLGFELAERDYQLEVIKGGSLKKTKEEYNHLLALSIKEMYRVLKFDRWMSFVFAHKDPEFWHLIIETAEKCGFEYAAAIKQSNGQTSYRKRKDPFTILSGQLIINFKKVRRPKYIMKAALGLNIGEILIQTCEGVIAKNNGATLEEINDELIIKGLELGFLDLLKKEYSDLTPFLLDTFDYDKQTKLFTIRQDQKFQTRIDLDLRIRYYLISFLRRRELENKLPTFDEIVLHIMPLLKNGITPKRQTILNVLVDIAEHTEQEYWQLRRPGQQRLFN